MAQNRALSLGGIGSPCCCGCKFTIHTTWCLGCVAPGTITVTAQYNNSSGAIAATVTADASGNAVFSLSSGTYYFSASTSSSGYMNDPVTVTIANCTPTGASSPIYPDQLTLTDPVYGAVTLLPYGTISLNQIPPITGDLNHFIGYLTIVFPSTCGCPGLSVDVLYVVDCNGTTGLQLSVFLQTCIPIGLPDGCPGTTPSPGYQANTSGEFTGTGPGASPCYPLSMSVSVTESINTPINAIYGFCSRAATVTYTLTQ